MRPRMSALPVLFMVLAALPVLAQDAPQPNNPFQGGGGADQPPAPPPMNPFAGGDLGPQAPAPVQGALGGGAAADPTGGDPAKQKQLLDDMVAKKVVYKANVKGRTASLWVADGFAELAEDQQLSLARAAYKIWVVGTEAKFKGPMSIFLSDGEKPGLRLGMYVSTLKGDGLKMMRSKKQQQTALEPGFVPPVVPVEPPADPNDPFNQ